MNNELIAHSVIPKTKFCLWNLLFRQHQSDIMPSSKVVAYQ